MDPKMESASLADKLADVRTDLGHAISLIDIGRAVHAAGDQPNFGVVISALERAEQKLDEVAEEMVA